MEPLASVAVEVLVERNQIAPLRIALEILVFAEHRAAPVLVAHNPCGHPCASTTASAI